MRIESVILHEAYISKRVFSILEATAGSRSNQKPGAQGKEPSRTIDNSIGEYSRWPRHHAHHHYQNRHRQGEQASGPDRILDYGDDQCDLQAGLGEPHFKPTDNL
jgi:hypothetical protein